MKKANLVICLLGGLCLILFVGCGAKTTGEIKTVDQAAQQITTEFASAPPQVQQNAQMAADALKNNNYDQAFAAITAIQKNKDITFEQEKSAKMSMHALQRQLMNELENGNTNVLPLIQALGASRLQP